ncbi:hypothetical protein MAR_016850 [Mya arenaria]|uniref:Uncharacterized protein n=1 Tax=Mya arenaria TaxID=6604 RepID=A0ABY7EA24_MYAAR|nr:hypothetical protein MAR_016850 [Mya arenaria]
MSEKDPSSGASKGENDILSTQRLDLAIWRVSNKVSNTPELERCGEHVRAVLQGTEDVCMLPNRNLTEVILGGCMLGNELNLQK